MQKTIKTSKTILIGFAALAISCSDSGNGKGGNHNTDGSGNENSQTAEQAVEQDATNLEIGFSGSDSADGVTADIVLPDSGPSGTTIGWQSDNPAVVSADGTVVQPEFGSGNVQVTLTATITSGTISQTVTFTVVVVEALPDIIDLEAVDPTGTIVRLAFTSVGGSQYDIRYSLNNITNDNQCSAATSASVAVSPASAGVGEYIEVIGLAEETTYYFCVRVIHQGVHGVWLHSGVSATTLTAAEPLGDFVTANSGGLTCTAGVIFAPDGNLLVGSYNPASVIRYNGNTGEHLGAFVSIGLGGLSGTWGLVYGPNGNLFVSSQSSSEIIEYNGSTGALVGTFVSAGSGGLVSPIYLKFGSDGNLYVASHGTSQVLRYNGTTGDFIDVFASGSGLANPLGLVFGPDGHLYVSSGGTDQVLRYNGTTGAFIDVFAEGGGIDRPGDLLFSSNGSLLVVGYNSGNVIEYNGTTGAFERVLIANGTGGMTNNGEGITFDDAGNLYVGVCNGTTGHKVVKFVGL